MSRFMSDDIAATRERLQSDSEAEGQQTARPSWLRHANQRGAVIDHLLVFGASMEDLITLSGSKNENSVRGHLNHLQSEHQLPIIRSRDGLYMFDRGQLDADDAWSDDVSTGNYAVPISATASSEGTLVGVEDNSSQTQPDVGASLDTPEEPSRQPISFPCKSVQLYWGMVVMTEGGDLSARFSSPEQDQTFAEFDWTQIALIIAGPDPEGIRLAVETVLEVARSYDRRGAGNWKIGTPADPAQYYIYQHSDDAGAFYIGKGKGSRAFEHIRSVVNRVGTNELIDQSRKDQRILALIVDGSEIRSDRIDCYKARNVRSLPIPIGDHAEMAAFVAEDFIISGLHGVYDLTNETGGNDRFGCFSWLVRPAAHLGVSDGWRRACSYFLKERRLSSAARAEITFINASDVIKKKPIGLKALGEISGVEIGALQKVGQDVFVDVSVSRMPFRVQLLFSAKDPNVKFNIRPARNTKGGGGKSEARMFQAALDNLLAANSHLDWVLRMPTAVDPYVKPFAEKGNGRVEPRFNILDLEDRVSVSLPGMGGQERSNIIDAFMVINRLFEM